jgi:mRNA interferase MazF
MKKDYSGWHAQKATINDKDGTALFHEREIWWCSLGLNVGTEQDGGQDYERPVVILRKFNLESSLVAPLTGRTREGRYYFPLGRIDDRDATVILSQIRFIDRKRLKNKIAMLPMKTFDALTAAVIRANFRL